MSRIRRQYQIHNICVLFCKRRSMAWHPGGGWVNRRYHVEGQGHQTIAKDDDWIP